MIFYDVIANIKDVEIGIESNKNGNSRDIEDDLPFGGSDDIKKLGKSELGEMNEQLGFECGLEGNISVCIYGGKENIVELFMGCKLENVSLDACTDYVAAYIKGFTGASDVEVKVKKELRAKDVIALEKRADSLHITNYSGRVYGEIGIDYFTNYQFKVRELLYSKKLSKKAVLKEADRIMADDSLIEEIERIYSNKSSKEFKGHPVHYKITASEDEAAKAVIDVLIPALKSNNRLLGQRVTWISNIRDGCYDEDDMRNLFENSQGETIVIEMRGDEEERGNYASAYRQVIKYFRDLVNRYKLNTLCIFVENTKEPGFSKFLVGDVQDDLSLIEIKDGRGSKEKATNYLISLAKEDKYTITSDEANELLPNKNIYTVSDVCGVYKKWFSDALKNTFYTQYKDCDVLKVQYTNEEIDPLKELNEMVGLTEVKELVDEILDSAIAQKMRDKMGLKTTKSSMHMIFTGNPGSAKTTVARLVGQILKKVGVLESGQFVECGRNDLVGAYVGWTAKAVVKKFREARGGILFIDEAYSLVDDRDGSFGDEAINTIVQQMENHRDDVIVIFAGYPEKMKKFLEKNEGLRSRIAFHLNFKDYNPQEMLDIMHLMVKNKGYRLDSDVDAKCLGIFAEACEHEEFGNGRYARNLLEQAIMRQGKRVVSENKGKRLTKRALTTLKACDFEVNAGNQYKEARNPFGFAV